MTFRETRIHVIGIGGIGTSGIARMLLADGKIVTGSDAVDSPVTRTLQAAGIPVRIPQSPGNIPGDAELVVISAAIKDDNPELLEARRRGIPVQKYAQVLGRLMNERRGIAVAGTHGKTTTTAMIAVCLRKAGLDPSVVVGAAVGPLGGSSVVGAGDLFVVEACEYDRSFHNLRPHCAVINNVEEDHLDYYHGGIGEIVESFAQFASQVRPEGLLVAKHGDKNVSRAIKKASCKVETFALSRPAADWSARALRPRRGLYRFNAFHGREDVGSFELAIPGRHNVLNSLAAIACCHWAGAGFDAMRDALREFRGADRRFDILGEAAGVTVVDDYAHHPTKVRESLRAARQFFKSRRMFVVFQPHQHSRTRFLLADFAAAFGDADVVLVPDIFFVRDSEAERQQVSSADLVRAMKTLGNECYYLPTFPEIEQHLRDRLTDGDVVITMGAGDVYKLAQNVLKFLELRQVTATT
jgi:UDP-N-acetylmuramate--alanine ligase